MYRLIILIIYFFFGNSIIKKFNFKYEKVTLPSEPFILLCNHNTDVDGYLAAIAFIKYRIFFVMSEHVLRRRLSGAVIKLLLNPISRQKGISDYKTVKDILIRIKAGKNICIFAEGVRSPDGVTCEISPSTGKLIKLSNATLVTYRFRGGYFAQPRWATSFRKGSIKGELVGVYSPEEIKEMSLGEVNRIIGQDLNNDDYEIQKASPVKYRGKKPAERIETVLYCCPSCESLASLKSNNDTFECCLCKKSFRYDDYGKIKCLNGNSAPFDSVRDWYRWENEYINSKKDFYVSLSKNQPIVKYNDQWLRKITRRFHAKDILNGNLIAYNDRISIEGNGQSREFFYSEITAMDICDIDMIVFSTATRERYEIVSKHYKSAYIYLALYEMLHNGDASS